MAARSSQVPLLLLLPLLALAAATAAGARVARGVDASSSGAEDGDDPAARAALIALSDALQPSLQPGTPSHPPWGSGIGSYCAWSGVSCCAHAAALLPVPCANASDVVALNLSAVGLQGTLPVRLGDSLERSLQLLNLAHNPGLAGGWPPGLLLPSLASLDIRVRMNGKGNRRCHTDTA